MEHVSTDKNKNMIQNICNKNEGVSYAMRLLFFVDYKNRFIFLSCDILRISLIYAFSTSKQNNCKLIKRSNQPIHTFFSHFCTHLFYIEGNGKEGKVHEDLVLSKMSETFVVHIVFNLSEHGLRFYASLSSVFQSFLGTQQLFGFLPVSSESVILFYRPVPLCLKISASQRTVFTSDGSVSGIFADISKCCFHMSGPYPLHLLSHRADTKVMFFIVVEVFRLERVRFEP